MDFDDLIGAGGGDFDGTEDVGEMFMFGGAE
jgi:hypothetical protein